MKWLALFLVVIGVSAATLNSPTGSRTDVLSTIGSSSAGDTIVIPGGTFSWSGDITITGITIQGPGKASGSPLNITAGQVTITKHATQYTKMIGIRFTGNNQHFSIGGTASNKAFVVGDCYFFNDGFEPMAAITTNGGLLYSSDFDTGTPHTADTFAINLGGVGQAGQTSWQAATTMGTDDTTGEANTYFEDCTWDGFLEVSMDVDNGARVAIRHCTFTDSSLVLHGGGNGAGGQDTSSYGGRQLEIYNNIFDRVNGNISINKWIWMRGSTGVFASNAVDNASFGMFPGKVNIRFSVGCPSNPGYPMAYQVGQSTQTPDSTPNQPYLIIGNTGTATTDPSWISISGDSGEGITCSDPNAYIQSSRDYVTSNTWGWVPYTYPHPLRGATAQASASAAISGRVSTSGKVSF